jgi:hypothetical protein
MRDRKELLMIAGLVVATAIGVVASCAQVMG